MIAWTDEQIDTLRAMWAEGQSAAEIARAITGDITKKGAVIGKARRLDLGRHKDAHKLGRLRGTAPPPPPRPTRGKHSGLLARVAQRLPIKGVCTDASAVRDLPPDRSDFAVSLFDARDGDCRYPLNAAVPIIDFRFCGAPAVSGCSWCQRHLGLVMKPRQAAGKTIRALAQAAS